MLHHAMILFLACLVLGGCLGPPRDVTEPPGVGIVRDQEFAHVDGRTLRLDIYRAEGATRAQPCVLWIYGGGWLFGTRSPCPIARLALRGYTVVAVEYRLSDEAMFPAALHDVKAGVRWVRANAAQWGIDPARIGVFGVSAGGHLASLLAATSGQPWYDGGLGPVAGSTDIACAVAFFPPTDLPRLMDPAEDVSWKMKLAVRRMVGGDPVTDTAAAELARLASPIHLITARHAPLLLVHGTDDELIPVQHSIDYSESLLRQGVDAHLRAVVGFNHGNMLLADAEVRRDMHAFLDRVLKPDIPPGAPE
jgi:acetyl esterase/lipase